jgi:hypothetical protein
MKLETIMREVRERLCANGHTIVVKDCGKEILFNIYTESIGAEYSFDIVQCFGAYVWRDRIIPGGECYPNMVCLRIYLKKTIDG